MYTLPVLVSLCVRSCSDYVVSRTHTPDFIPNRAAVPGSRRIGIFSHKQPPLPTDEHPPIGYCCCSYSRLTAPLTALVSTYYIQRRIDCLFARAYFLLSHSRRGLQYCRFLVAGRLAIAQGAIGLGGRLFKRNWKLDHDCGLTCGTRRNKARGNYFARF